MRKYWKVELESGAIINTPSDKPQSELECIRTHKAKAVLARLNRSVAYKKHLKDNPTMSSIKRVLDGNDKDMTTDLVHAFNKAMQAIQERKKC